MQTTFYNNKLSRIKNNHKYKKIKTHNFSKMLYLNHFFLKKKHLKRLQILLRSIQSLLRLSLKIKEYKRFHKIQPKRIKIRNKPYLAQNSNLHRLLKINK